jgi:hypothetical protein
MRTLVLLQQKEYHLTFISKEDTCVHQMQGLLSGKHIPGTVLIKRKISCELSFAVLWQKINFFKRTTFISNKEI